MTAMTPIRDVGHGMITIQIGVELLQISQTLKE